MNIVQRLFAAAPAMTTITGACVAVYLVAALQAGSFGDTVWDSDLGTRTVLYGPFVSSEGPTGWLRLLTAAFLHLNLAHVATNMFMLVLVGGEVERLVGTARFVLAFVAGAVGSSAAVLVFDFDTPTAGASGALFSLLVVFAALAYRRHLDPRGPVALLLCNVAFTFIAPGVSVWGHVGGLVAGLVVAWPLTWKSEGR